MPESFGVSLKSPGGGSVFTSAETTALFLLDKDFTLCTLLYESQRFVWGLR